MRGLVCIILHIVYIGRPNCDLYPPTSGLGRAVYTYVRGERYNYFFSVFVAEHMKPRSQTKYVYKYLSTYTTGGTREPTWSCSQTLSPWRVLGVHPTVQCLIWFYNLSCGTVPGIIERSIPSYPPYLNQPSHFSCDFHQTQLSSWHGHEVGRLYIFPIFILLIPRPPLNSFGYF